MDFAIAAVVGLVAVVAFLPILTNGFVEHWDDQTNFLQNPSFRGLGWPQVRWAWTTTLQGAYQPLAWMLLELEYVGWALDPRGYHVVSLVLHAVNAVLFYALIRRLMARSTPVIEARSRRLISVMAGLASAAFAVHPLRVEVVAWASCQPYLPCAGFAMLSMLAYLRSFGGNVIHPGWRFASVALYAAALGCKAVPVGLPLVLLILDITVLGRRGAGRSLWLLAAEKIPYVIPAIAVSYLAVQAKSAASPPKGSTGAPARTLVQRAAMAGYGLCYYLEKTAWPRDLSAYHFRRDPIEPAAQAFAGRIAAVATLGAVTFLLRRRWPAIFSAVLSYAILLAPNLGIIPYGFLLVADRYAYVATMPLFAVAAAWSVRRVESAGKPVAVEAAILAAGLCLIAALASMSWAQCRTWRDSRTLWVHALSIGSGRDSLLESNLGIELFDAGRVEEGMAHLRRAVGMDPADADAQENLGIALLKQREEGQGIAHMAEAIRLAPDRFDFHHRLGLALSQRGQLVEAAHRLRQAARLNPGNADVHVSLGHVLVDLQHREEAIAEFTRALLLVPGHQGAWRGLERLRDGGRPTP